MFTDKCGKKPDEFTCLFLMDNMVVRYSLFYYSLLIVVMNVSVLLLIVVSINYITDNGSIFYSWKEWFMLSKTLILLKQRRYKYMLMHVQMYVCSVVFIHVIAMT